MPVCEVTRDEIMESCDWECVFAEPGNGSGGNCTADLESLDGTPIDPVTRDDIDEVIASVNGEKDVEYWIGVFRLKDGRFLAASGGCDYTGWD